MIFRLALLLLTLSIIGLAFVDRSSPAYVPAALSVTLNAATAVGTLLCIRYLSRHRQG